MQVTIDFLTKFLIISLANPLVTFRLKIKIFLIAWQNPIPTNFENVSEIGKIIAKFMPSSIGLLRTSLTTARR